MVRPRFTVRLTLFALTLLLLFKVMFMAPAKDLHVKPEPLPLPQLSSALSDGSSESTVKLEINSLLLLF